MICYMCGAKINSNGIEWNREKGLMFWLRIANLVNSIETEGKLYIKNWETPEKGVCVICYWDMPDRHFINSILYFLKEV